ncbi:metal transporter [Francisella sp. LA112445]|uniref:HoxN/HupN/NixA family nickel/cobalt transporter n=1 Tax=Francisella sp. LA112445 TaxID=1395624 RepID=UPI001788B327|nr:metal transporter [Francisella sp. LA112445]QIW11026.1 metal transporter [Francisella sp. LA112445]
MRKNITIFSLLILVLLLFLATQDIKMLSMIGIAFLLGLRHGFDADHIVAIDNVTRQLVTQNRASFRTGLFFALGHSTIVFLLTLLIVIGFSFANIEKTSALDIGAFFGTIVSAIFLLLTGTMSLISLKNLLKNKNDSAHDHTSNSLLAKLFRPLIKVIDRPYKMYFIGFLFGLGFDTATEIALLGMAAANVLNGLSIWYIMLLPFSFALGMIIVDSIDAGLMSKVLSINIKEQRFYRYNVIILSIVVAAAYIVALVELLGLLNTNIVTINIITGFVDNYSSTIGLTLVMIFSVFFVFKFVNIYSKRKIK